MTATKCETNRLIRRDAERKCLLRYPDERNIDQIERVSTLTPAGGPGRLNKSFWSSS